MTDPFDAMRELEQVFIRTIQAVDQASAGMDAYERERAMYALVSAYSLSEEMWIFKADPAQPVFTDWMAHGRKTAGDSPYTIYQTAPISPRYRYRLHGNLGEATYFGAQLYKYVHGFNALSGVISQDNIVTDAAGNFEIILSQERPANAINWLPLLADDYILMTREYRYDPTQQRPVQIAIERIDGAPGEPLPLAARVAKAAAYFEAIVLSTIEIASLLSVNQFSPPDAEVRTPKYGDSLFPNRDTYYDGFVVKLEPGQAIKLSGRLPEEWVYVSFVFYDRWYATLDYPRERCYLTGRDLQLNADGSYDIYISPQDPGHPNWIQMGQLHEGLFSYRFMLANANPKPAVQVVTSEN